VTRRRRRRSKKLLDDLGDRRGFSHLKEEALEEWRNRFGRGFGPVCQITDNDDLRGFVSLGALGPDDRYK
jgi:hypothetical protein